MPDVNILLAAHRQVHPNHAESAAFLETLVRSGPFALSELVLSGFLRLATHRAVFDRPSTLEEALEFVSELVDQPDATLFRPGLEHWHIFTELCRKSKAAGNQLADAYHAALAIEHGCEWVTADGDYARFPGLRWRHPQAPE